MSVRCGNCKGTHERAVDVRECYAELRDMQREHDAEVAAERAAERYWEEGTSAQQMARQAEQDAEDRMYGSDTYWDAEMQRRERAEDEAVARFKAERDRKLSEPHARDGYYTVEFADGDYRTIRLRTQPADASFAPGEQVAAFLSGPDNESSYTGFAFVKPDGRFNLWKRFRDDTRIADALRVLLEDPQAAGLGFARRSGNCMVCNRTLTTPESIERGIGPVCFEGAA